MLFKETGVRELEASCGFRRGTCRPFHNIRYKYRKEQSKRRAGQPQREVFIGKQQKQLHSVLSSLPRAPSLRRKGENHPTDDEVEKENGIDDQSFAVWGLAVCQEGCRGCENKQGRPHVGNITHQIKSASRPYPQKPWLLASPRLFPPQETVQTDGWIWSGSGPGELFQIGQEGKGQAERHPLYWPREHGRKAGLKPMLQEGKLGPPGVQPHHEDS